MFCPCNSNLDYANCCGRFIDTSEVPKTPEELMRSRYTAYTQSNMDYIIKTMKPPASDEFEPVSSREWAEKSDWIKLEIVKTKTEGDAGWVEFIAVFDIDKKQHVLHELSEFRREAGVWYYIDGQEPKKTKLIKAAHVGRNDPCTCGSGKKFKKCCGV